MVYLRPFSTGLLALAISFNWTFGVCGGQSVAFSPDSKTVASASFHSDGMVRLWDATSGKETGQWQGHERGATCVTFSVDGKTLASGGYDHAVVLWDLASGKETCRFQGHRANVTSVVFLSDGKTVASACGATCRYPDKTVRLWEIASGKEVHQSRGCYCDVHSLVISPDGKTWAWYDGELVVRLWEAASGREIYRLHVAGRFDRTTARSVAFSPDGRLLASGGYDKVVRLWNPASGECLRELQGHESTVHYVAFSPDGKLLASASDDGTVRLWGVAGEKEIKKLQGLPKESVRSVAFSPDGRLLASAETNGTVRIWQLSEVCPANKVPPAKLDPKRISPTKLDSRQLQSLWADLASDDAGKAYQAAGGLILGAQESVPFLHGRLPPVTPPDAQRVARLVTDLDDDAFTVRERANQELEQLGELAQPALQKALGGQSSAEVQYRAEALLNKLANSEFAPGRLRIRRAVMVLEQIGNSEARHLLETLSKGADGALLTGEAGAAMKRLKRLTVSRE